MNNEDKQTLDVSGGTGMPFETLNWQEGPSNIEFRKAGEWVMRITARRVEVNEGIDVTEAAQTVLEALQKLMGQPEQKPLTGEQIEFAWMKAMQSTPGTTLPIHEFARAIEQAHGIGEKT